MLPRGVSTSQRRAEMEPHESDDREMDATGVRVYKSREKFEDRCFARL